MAHGASKGTLPTFPVTKHKKTRGSSPGTKNGASLETIPKFPVVKGPVARIQRVHQARVHRGGPRGVNYVDGGRGLAKGGT